MLRSGIVRLGATVRARTTVVPFARMASSNTPNISNTTASAYGGPSDQQRTRERREEGATTMGKSESKSKDQKATEKKSSIDQAASASASNSTGTYTQRGSGMAKDSDMKSMKDSDKSKDAFKMDKGKEKDKTKMSDRDRGAEEMMGQAVDNMSLNATRNKEKDLNPGLNFGQSAGSKSSRGGSAAMGSSTSMNMTNSSSSNSNTSSSASMGMGMESDAADSMSKKDSQRSVVSLIKGQHREIKTLMQRVCDTRGREREEAFGKLEKLLLAHEAAEEQVVHPSTASMSTDERVHEEEEATKMLAKLKGMSVDSVEFEKTFERFKSDVTKHAEAEEREELAKLSESKDRRELASMREKVEKVEQEHGVDATKNKSKFRSEGGAKLSGASRVSAEYMHNV